MLSAPKVSTKAVRQASDRVPKSSACKRPPLVLFDFHKEASALKSELQRRGAILHAPEVKTKSTRKRAREALQDKQNSSPQQLHPFIQPPSYDWISSCLDSALVGGEKCAGILLARLRAAISILLRCATLFHSQPSHDFVEARNLIVQLLLRSSLAYSRATTGSPAVSVTTGWMAGPATTPSMAASATM